jgi:methionine aminopeptidase
MQPGNVFTIEPIFMMRQSKEPHVWRDEMTLVSPNNPSGKLAWLNDFLAQWEHTILITQKGCEVLTKRKDEDIKV